MKRKYVKVLRLLTGAMVYMMVVTGCGSSDGAYATKSMDESYATESAMEGGVYDAEYEEAYDEGSTNSSTQAEEITEEKSSAKQKRKLITNMSMNTETKEFDKTVDFLQKRTEELDGYVESFSTDKSSYSEERTANLTLRIPEEKLSGFVTEVADVSNITSQEMNVTDVTLTYADLESHRNALRAEEEQLLTLMEKAETIEDIMTIQDKLTDVRYQLESMESQLRTYDNQITYSTLRVTVREVIEYTPEPVKNPSFWERARDGFLDNCEGVATFFKEFALLIITHLPVLTILIIIVIIIIAIVRFANKKSKERLANRPPVMPGPVPGGMPPVRPNDKPNQGTAQGKSVPPIPQGPTTYGKSSIEDKPVTKDEPPKN
ncbi:DUF4349 domain-containing protein [Butyrivibrio sp. FC2001]|uniref:DUF4349 domain-containing protein n=1 Tax=Butyrivibrio sp. FC2001 TaxID=1280671 RepID=UPI000421B960|nr:DUF4349 domain-containing protein [Butyrivibrio sp. FC2001]